MGLILQGEGRRPTSLRAVVNHHNVQPVVEVYVNVQDRDLGALAREIEGVVAEFQSQLPRGSWIVVRGQAQSMNAALVGLGAGMVFAIVLVYMLMVVNFQSWLDPLIIIMALPGALAGMLREPRCKS